MQTGREVLSSLLNSLSAIDKEQSHTSNTSDKDATSSKPTSIDTAETKKILVTLHFIFPHELLPALDLIDRRLITHLTLSKEEANPALTQQPIHHGDQTNQTGMPRMQTYFFVQSASSSNSGEKRSDATGSTGRFRNVYNSTKVYYEVDLDGWNCSCPAFAYSSIQLLTNAGWVDNAMPTGLPVSGQDHVSGCCYGRATVRGSIVPVCKHILAVCLYQAGPHLFGHGVQRLEGSNEEIAGWMGT